ncbi:hypothetical protein [Chthonobacter albigriseus]|uniref:hypothetical protein n=1 Tax=Chthonobacter albigriseus TaxID=1683161 RepID=UPI0019D6513C|nr:hypothetical protein [Chthonobacter albigriseus]
MARTLAHPALRTSRGAGLFRRTFEAMLGSRERQARHALQPHLLALDDGALEALGYSRKMLEREGVRSLNL